MTRRLVRSRPLHQFFHGADPFPGVNRIGDSIDPPVRCPEVGIRAEDGIIKKTGIRISVDAGLLLLHRSFPGIAPTPSLHHPYTILAWGLIELY